MKKEHDQLKQQVQVDRDEIEQFKLSVEEDRRLLESQ